jgi:hypothetical protein
MCAELRDWRSIQRRTPEGGVESEQRARFDLPLVDATAGGAKQLGELYWRTVERATGHVVRPRFTSEGIELRLLGRGPVLLRFGHAETSVRGALTECRYAIQGGLLARAAAGQLELAQRTNGEAEISSVVSGFLPRLGVAPGRPGWTGALCARVQARVHVAISRRYFATLERARG